MSHNKLLTVKQIIESEERYIKKNSLNKLINIASSKIAQHIEKKFRNKKILFVCGPGNNGLDGKLAYEKIKIKSKLSLFELNKKNPFDYKKLKQLTNTSEIIFDCIFGIGLNREILGDYKVAISLINDSKKRVISIDIPSGINSDSGRIMGVCVKAGQTLAINFLKPCYFLLPSKEFIGELETLDLDLDCPKKLKPDISLISRKAFEDKIPKHRLNANKHDKGNVLILGGPMSGASRLVAYSARKTGCGLSTIVLDEVNLKYYLTSEPGTIIKIFDKNDFDKKDVLVLGPGLGKNYNKTKILEFIKFFTGPVIIDADAISIFENFKIDLINLLKKKKNILLTPHLGEFKRLFKYSDDSKITDCIKASNLIQNCVLLKGNDTVISFPKDKVWVNSLSKNNLATAGSGDLLCGIIAGLIAQKMEFTHAILASVWIQSRISMSENHVTVEDFLAQIPAAINSLKNNN